MITHRCMESLKARVSIRYEKGWNIKDGQDAWWMYQPLYDYEWDTTFLTAVAEIRFCPFCGQELEVPSAQPEIIRCKDCKHWDGVDTCDVIDAPVWDNDFCSMAERRSNE